MNFFNHIDFATGFESAQQKLLDLMHCMPERLPGGLLNNWISKTLSLEAEREKKLWMSREMAAIGWENLHTVGSVQG